MICSNAASLLFLDTKVSQILLRMKFSGAWRITLILMMIIYSLRKTRDRSLWICWLEHIMKEKSSKSNKSSKSSKNRRSPHWRWSSSVNTHALFCYQRNRSRAPFTSESCIQKNGIRELTTGDKVNLSSESQENLHRTLSKFSMLMNYLWMNSHQNSNKNSECWFQKSKLKTSMRNLPK